MPKHIPVIKFHKDKYGDELQIDVVTLDMIRNSKTFAEVMRQSFFGIMLTTGGEGDVEVDGVPCVARKGLVACARPGDVCTVTRDEGLTSLELIFERNFVLEFFNDAHFLDGLAYFSPKRISPYLQLEESLYNRIVALYVEIQLEINHARDRHLLRAMLYETLMLLNKAMPVVSKPKESNIDRVARFRELVNEHFRTENGVEFYADRLCITPNYLNKIVRQNLGQSTKEFIQSRRIEEACRLLSYTTLSVNDIAQELNFDATSYFVRAFTLVEGITPLQYRKSHEK
ncbi:MAG: helix-turn-helix transcriptional regulator [Bacteroidales bacterium]|nr:helix-turn-helix transcriptional regulator [Bacteroidales bacterium]MBR4138073.1 helix-turn-helix transcriptional regulator [Bacteroidales bacterium]MBR6438446.1 helix-turn-helix transcriptional regulator [Bacteroidales bacterium]